MTSKLKMKMAGSPKPLAKSEPSSKTTARIKDLPLGARALVRRFDASLQDTHLLPHSAKFLVAVSGGPDSIALVHLLNFLKPKYAWSIHLVHVNYGLRGKDSKLDEALVRSTSEQLDLPLSVLRSRVKPQKNIEETLRNIRYAYFEKIRCEKKYSFIATAHQQNDLAETFLLNLLRGAGWTGLSPLLQQRKIVRPLLPFKKNELLAFLAATKMPFRLDRTNSDLTITRNRIRYALLPFLEKEFNPNIIATLGRTAEHLALVPKELLPVVIEKKGPSTYVFDRSFFLALKEPEQVAFLSVLYSWLLEKSPSTRFLQSLQRGLGSRKNKIQTYTTRDLNIRCFSDRVETTLRKI